jgi:hypothetical protein
MDLGLRDKIALVTGAGLDLRGPAGVPPADRDRGRPAPPQRDRDRGGCLSARSAGATPGMVGECLGGGRGGRGAGRGLRAGRRRVAPPLWRAGLGYVRCVGPLLGLAAARSAAAGACPGVWLPLSGGGDPGTMLVRPGCERARKRNKKVAVHPCPRALLRARREERWPCGLRVAIKRHRQSKAWQAGAERWTSLDMGERGVLGRACMLAPTSKRSNRLAHTTNAMSRCVPVSLRSHGLRATFLLRFHQPWVVPPVTVS